MQKTITSLVPSAIDGEGLAAERAVHDDDRLLTRVETDETGAATAEYAIATLAAVVFAGLLVVILRSEQVRGLLAGIIKTALTVAG